MPLALVLLAAPRPPSLTPVFDETAAERFANLALACVAREYPNKIAHTLESDRDARPPRLLTPVFFGCYDWHSSVHAHWLLARLASRYPTARFVLRARVALGASFTKEKVAGEVAYLEGVGRATFERPYGLAWLLQLAAELRAWDDPEARAWSATLAPLERAAASRLADWLPKLAYPIREGEHGQTAFAFGLVLDWARAAKDVRMEKLVSAKTRDLYSTDRDCPTAYEPSGQDFLSPCLAEADLMRRVLAPPAFSSWLRAFMPGIPEEAAPWMKVATVTDPSDGKLAHLDGLNLSRAWMLEGIAASLPPNDPRLPALRSAAAEHRSSGLASVTGAHYEGGHWLGTFAVYLVTGAGLPKSPGAAP